MLISKYMEVLMLDRLLMVDHVKDILKEQLVLKTASESQFERLDKIISQLRDEFINENFQGTIEEIHSYVKNSPRDKEMDDFVNLHRLNITRWLEELTLLNEGGGAVTIDYKQRQGREV
ncbi:YtzH-like family protein [Evansella sp. AB-rgal1]|uniref:YtzH-like family protein n=1 Tax=Evansella sp. AB-rgal1 TaxID=3242696 RepID=UPI00359D3824